ncbi:MAG: hypothetical protein ACYTEQ_03980 [Planctomycetota bacterium]|jgi:hypothetical protein
MRKVIVLAILAPLVAAGVATAEEGQDLSHAPWLQPDQSFAGPCYGRHMAWGGPVPWAGAGEISRLLQAVNDTGQRAKLAEQWLKFSQQSVLRNWELQKEWLELQKSYLKFQHELGLLRMENLRLQQQINQLQADILRLERENMELRSEIQQRTAKQGKRQ